MLLQNQITMKMMLQKRCWSSDAKDIVQDSAVEDVAKTLCKRRWWSDVAKDVALEDNLYIYGKKVYISFFFFVSIFSFVPL